MNFHIYEIWFYYIIFSIYSLRVCNETSHNQLLWTLLCESSLLPEDSLRNEFLCLCNTDFPLFNTACYKEILLCMYPNDTQITVTSGEHFYTQFSWRHKAIMIRICNLRHLQIQALKWNESKPNLLLYLILCNFYMKCMKQTHTHTCCVHLNAQRLQNSSLDSNWLWYYGKYYQVLGKISTVLYWFNITQKFYI
jgi:hypothetical protein